MAALTPDAEHVAIERNSITACEQQQCVTGRELANAFLGDLMQTQWIVGTRFRVGGNDNEARCLKHCVGRLPGCAILRSSVEIEHLPRSCGKSRRFLPDSAILLKLALVLTQTLTHRADKV